MFSNFLNKYSIDKTITVNSGGDVPQRLVSIEGARNFLVDNQGASFGGGVYKVLPLSDIKKWNEIVLGIFSQFEGQIECFGIDWLGRVFAWDFENNKVLSLDPGFGEAITIPCSFVELHNIEFVEYSDESLSSGLYHEYVSKNGKLELGNKCIGYRVSPFLGGEDNVDNLEAIDSEVYWSISTEIFNKVQSM
ncbi:T6SS immunity protein Tdi1 domain-containing protein [Pseudoalteromonas maricaloris]|uniref:T6SS immunity protein Tdi1 domain-containing protein n=1 Tax=Pseudoalteromonas maricaloris TaxID=184924 RepID=UPI0002FF042B|nr:T6SS immunity protein Tdi1 domain-containing protein [Pseudoalteromonas flavipulchra]